MGGWYSVDLRERVVAAYEQGGVTEAEVAEIFSVGEASVRRWRRRKRETGTVTPWPRSGGMPAKVRPHEQDVLRAIVAEMAMATQLINATLNVALDALFVLALGWGVAGAAVATVLSQMVSATWTLGHFLSPRSVLKLRLANLRLRWSVVQPALAIGLAPFSMHVGASVVALLLNRALARHGGDLAIGAYGVIGALAMLALMPVFGITQGAQPIIGFNYGAGNLARVRRALWLAAGAATVVLCTAFVVVQAAPAALVRVFARDPQMVAVGARGIRICLAMLPVVGFQVVSASFFQAIGKARVALLLSLLRQVLVLIPLILVLPDLIGLDGVWMAGPISDGVSSLLTAGALAWQLRSLAAPDIAGPPPAGPDGSSGRAPSEAC